MNNGTLEIFVRNAVNLARHLNMDGFDIDWEYPESSQNGCQLAYLLRRIKEVRSLFLSDDALKKKVCTRDDPQRGCIGRG